MGQESKTRPPCHPHKKNKRRQKNYEHTNENYKKKEKMKASQQSDVQNLNADTTVVEFK